MRKVHPQNERIKHKYFEYLNEAKRKSEATIDIIRKSIIRYEEYTAYKDFKTFNKEKAIHFKKHLTNVKSQRSKKPLSKSTLLNITRNVKEFFVWLAYQQGYKSKVQIPDTDYLNLSEKDMRIAKATKRKDFPSIEQIKKVVSSMPEATEMEKRNRALIAFTVLTGMRDSAIASLRLKHVDIDKRLVDQIPDEVNTKFSKHILTYFFPVGDDLIKIVAEWVRYLIEVKLFSPNDPLFPRTKIICDKNNSFQSDGVVPVLWQSANQIRHIFKDAFTSAGMKYYSPHTFRDTLVNFGERVCNTPEEFKAWSQNLGHEQVLTTFTSYGAVSPYRQGEIMETLSGVDVESNSSDINKKLDLILKKI